MKTEEQKKRLRHSKEGLDAILSYEGTPEWLRRAIRLTLVSLQRREDIVTWEKSSVDLEANTIKVSPGKTQSYDKPVHLEIAMGSALHEVVKECLPSPVICPFLIDYTPKARKREQLEAKLHWSAVTDDYLTKEFRKARDLAKAYDHIENPKARPTIHKLRALGSWLYEQQGFSTEYVQALMGHATPEMTAYYQEGHEQKEVVYQHVEPGLKL
ncbi:tyrosine-type recombinase/integrase [Pseudomonas sp. 8AS]|uniref:tyrosine-type recombinase/integrase n=1 Tax=Pseudomonas sp. 8AS TaxID=2653163 RepID=UPI0021153577|nr:tyrosine-type recombinase/integrase [Pseudomonas sp. 8AS]